MITFSDFSDFLNNQVNTFDKEFEDIVIICSLDLKALIENRVSKESKDTNGQTFGTRDKNGNKRRGYAESTKKMDRNFADPPFPLVSFRHTNTLWSSTKPVIIRNDDQFLEIQIKPTRDNREEILAILETKFETEIIAANTEEIDFIIENIDDKIGEYFDNILSLDITINIQ